eukprot:31091-Hanusia_phi.AAC.2
MKTSGAVALRAGAGAPICQVKKAKPEAKPDVSAITDVAPSQVMPELQALEDAFSEATTESKEPEEESEEEQPEEEPETEPEQEQEQEQEEQKEEPEQKEEQEQKEEEEQKEEQEQGQQEEQEEEKSEEVTNVETTVVPETTPVPEETQNQTETQKKCPSNVYTIQGCCCKFPFDFQGQTYDKCIDAGHQVLNTIAPRTQVMAGCRPPGATSRSRRKAVGKSTGALLCMGSCCSCSGCKK